MVSFTPFKLVATIALFFSVPVASLPHPQAETLEKRVDFARTALTLPIVFEMLQRRSDKVFKDIDAAGSAPSEDTLDQLLDQLSGAVSTSIGSLSQLHGLPLHQINNAADGSHILTVADDLELLANVSRPIKTRLEAITAPLDPSSTVASHAAEIRSQLDTLAEDMTDLLRDAPDANKPLVDLSQLSAKEGLAVVGLGVAALNLLGYK